MDLLSIARTLAPITPMGGYCCSVSACDNKRYLRGWCKTHYEQNRLHGSPFTRKDVIARFVASAISSDTVECILWPYSKNPAGYGRITAVKREGRVLAHRYVCEQAHGKRPSENSVVAHRCGVPSCINPRHLRWATQAENMADKVIHGTRLRGLLVPWSALTEQQVRDILVCKTESMKMLAQRHGVNVEMIRKVWSGHNWSWLEEDINVS